MKSYIFNEEFFKIDFLKDKNYNITSKYGYICNKVGIDESTIHSYRKGSRNINKKSYEKIKNEVDGLLVLNTETLIYKFFEEANKDFTTNEKFVAFIMLRTYEERGISRKWISLKELENEFTFKTKKVLEILDNSMIKINDNNQEKMFLKNEAGLYVINISGFIKYVESKK